MASMLFASPILAEKTGIGKIIFENTPTNDVADTNFFINEMSYTTIKLHLNIANKNNIDLTAYE